MAFKEILWEVFSTSSYAISDGYCFYLSVYRCSSTPFVLIFSSSSFSSKSPYSFLAPSIDVGLRVLDFCLLKELEGHSLVHNGASKIVFKTILAGNKMHIEFALNIYPGGPGSGLEPPWVPRCRAVECFQRSALLRKMMPLSKRQKGFISCVSLLRIQQCHRWSHQHRSGTRQCYALAILNRQNDPKEILSIRVN